MSRRKKFIQLSESELLTLQEGRKNGKKYQFRDRCHCLILSHSGKEVKEISQILEVSNLTVYLWLQRWELRGIVGLMNRRGQGRKAKLSLDNEQHVKLLAQLVDKYYQDVDRIRVELENKFDLTLSKDTVKRYLKKITFDGVAYAAVQRKDKIQ